MNRLRELEEELGKRLRGSKRKKVTAKGPSLSQFEEDFEKPRADEFSLTRSYRRPYLRAYSTINYTVPGILPTLRQPSSMTCWAAVTTMLYSWKRRQSFAIPDAIAEIGAKWAAKFNNNQGLNSTEKVSFIADAGLVAEPPMNHSIEGWHQMLRDYGPIWVTTDEAPGKPWAIHARIIKGIKGDGTANGTKFKIVDPAGGREYEESIAVFIPKYEEEVIRTGYTRIQVLHWPTGAQSQAQSQVAPTAPKMPQAPRQMGAVDYTVPGTVPVQAQRTSMVCWATVTAILMGWRDAMSYDIEAAMDMIGTEWGDMVRNNRGLPGADKPRFLAAAGLQAEPPMSFSTVGWEEMLRRFGPLWVTTDENPSAGFSIHARVLIAIRGDGTPAGTTMTLINPGGGRTDTESLQTFQRKFESEAATPGRALRVQVVHFPESTQPVAQSLAASATGTRRVGPARVFGSGTPLFSLMASQAFAEVGVYGQKPEGFLFVDVAQMVPGIDVSHHNGNINWARVAASGVRFAYIKATEGATFQDAQFASNWADARANNVPRGAYHLLRERSSSTPQAQAQNFTARVAHQAGDMPPAIDIEYPNLQSIINEEGIANAAAYVQEFWELLEAGTGYQPVLYMSKRGADSLNFNLGGLPALDLWIPRYRAVNMNNLPPLPEFANGNLAWPMWSIWQHSHAGRVDGIQGNVDLNLFNGDAANFQRWLRSVQPNP